MTRKPLRARRMYRAKSYKHYSLDISHVADSRGTHTTTKKVKRMNSACSLALTCSIASACSLASTTSFSFSSLTLSVAEGLVAGVPSASSSWKGMRHKMQCTT